MELSQWFHCSTGGTRWIPRPSAEGSPPAALASRLNLNARVSFTTTVRSLVVLSIAALAGCAEGTVDTGAYGSDGVKSSPSSFAEILAGSDANDVPSVCTVTTDDTVCSATLVAPSVVITAGHCAAGHGAWRVRCPFSGDTRERSATESAVAPTFPGGGATVDARSGSNLALLLLDQPFASTAVATMRFSVTSTRMPAIAVGRVSGANGDRLLVSREFALTYREPTHGYALGVDRVIVQNGDSGGGLFDPTSRELYGVSSSSVAIASCRARQPCTQWAALEPAESWIRSRLAGWNQTLPTGSGDTGDTGEEPTDPAGDAATPADDASTPTDGGAGEPGDTGDVGDTGEEPPAGESDAGSSTPPSGTGSDPCAAATDCASCTAIAVCGFCNGRCALGLPFGPLDASICAGQPWTWSASACR